MQHPLVFKLAFVGPCWCHTCKEMFGKIERMNKCKIHLSLCCSFASWIEHLGQRYKYLWRNACDYCCIIILIFSFFYLLINFHGKKTSLKQSRTLWNTIYIIKHLSSNYIDHFWQQATLQTTNFGQSSFTLTIPSNSTKTCSKPSFLATVQPPPPVIRVTWHGETRLISWQYIVHVTETLSWYKRNYPPFSLPEEFRSSF